MGSLSLQSLKPRSWAFITGMKDSSIAFFSLRSLQENGSGNLVEILQKEYQGLATEGKKTGMEAQKQ